MSVLHIQLINAFFFSYYTAYYTKAIFGKYNYLVKVWFSYLYLSI